MSANATELEQLERLFKAGTAAYQTGDYAKAQKLLFKLSQCSSQTYKAKADMGLVHIYMAQRQWADAKTLCQKFSKSAKPSFQQWGQATLQKIEAHSSGFQPLSAAKPTASINSGFQPLTSSSRPRADAEGDIHDESKSDLQNLSTNLVEKPANQSANQPAILSAVQTGDSKTYEWPYAGRLDQGRRLGKIKRSPLWLAQAFGITTIFAISLYFGRIAAIEGNKFLNLMLRFLPSRLLRGLSYIPENYRYLAPRVAVVLLVVAIASPWLWDLWLRFTASRQPFSIQKLRAICPEAATRLNSHCQQKQWPFPQLWKLPTDIPLIFSYGWLPRNARLVISEGLLSQLTADEIATLVSYEISHWQTGYWAFLSVQNFILQLFHQSYWMLSLWGNQQAKPAQWLIGVLASISYSLFWLLRLPGLWMSRVRTYYGDRAATESTGNPNALARALAKLSFGLAERVSAQGYTPPLVESLALLLPTSTDLIRQSLYGHMPLNNLFAWDSLNPLRSWMSLSDTHPPLGDRLRLIMAYARHWQLDLEIPLPAPLRREKALSQAEWAILIRQSLPFFGVACGLLTGLTLLLVGAMGAWGQWLVIAWMHRDTQLFWGCVLMGGGICTLLRINRFFPDLSFQMLASHTLPHWIEDPSLLPVNSLPAKFSGILIGRPGIANWLGQDLILKTTNHHLLKLHFFTAIGPFGNLISLQTKPSALIGNSVQVLGWFRRGNQPWIDIDQLRAASGNRLQAAHPIHALLISLIAILYALWLLGFGQLFEEVTNQLS